MILYNKSKTSYFRNHVVASHRRIFTLFSFMNGRSKIVDVYYDSILDESVETPLSRRKIPNDESSCTNAMSNYFVKKSYVPNHPNQI